MQPTSYTNFRANLAAMMDKVIDDHEPVVVTRGTAGSVVVMSLEDYNSMQETAYLLGHPANAAKLRGAVECHKAGNCEEVNLDSLGDL